LDNRKLRVFVRNLVVEVIIYGVLVIAFFFAVFHLLGDTLTDLFGTNRFVYALLGFGIILFQGIVLDLVTSFLLDRFEIRRPE
jgi:hypothetical protein